MSKADYITGLLQDVSEISEQLRASIEAGDLWDSEIADITVRIEGLCLDLIAECSGALNPEPHSDDVSYADKNREHRMQSRELI